MLSLYERAVKVLPADHIDHHESDLYLKATPEATALIREWVNDNGFQYAAKTFIDRFFCQIDGCFWYDIAFQYAPYWDSISR